MQHLPLTVKRSIELMGLVVAALIIIEGQQIIMPLVMAFFMSIVLLPVYRFLKKHKMPELVAIFLSLMVMIIVTGLIIFFITSQVTPLINDYPHIRENITRHINALSAWFGERTNISTTEQTKFLDDQSNTLLNYAGNILSGAAGSLGTAFIFFGLLPVYTFLMLYYKGILIRFVYMWFPKESHLRVREVIQQTETIVKSYILGLLIQITYITVLLGGSLMLFGIKHALLIGIIFGVLNLIPYIGALFGNIIGVLLTLSSTQDMGPVITVLVTIAVVQFLDNNILMPGIVGSKVRINALVCLAGVFIGGALAGIPGMFLSLPIIAVFKVIFDHTEQFKQWGVLFGDEKETKKSTFKFLNWKKNAAKNNSKEKKEKQE
ncbi:MAG TPA: AI-2E family transporter [Panacibacter sp.]|nr:AI-2E family transporter [Panacibacter sp.]